jgi:hypothetical protein
LGTGLSKNPLTLFLDSANSLKFIQPLVIFFKSLTYFYSF